jgi:hypothetical protein
LNFVRRNLSHLRGQCTRKIGHQRGLDRPVRRARIAAVMKSLVDESKKGGSRRPFFTSAAALSW